MDGIFFLPGTKTSDVIFQMLHSTRIATVVKLKKSFSLLFFMRRKKKKTLSVWNIFRLNWISCNCNRFTVSFYFIFCGTWYAENRKTECTFQCSMEEASNVGRILGPIKCYIFKSYSFNEIYSAALELRLQIERGNIVRK